MSAQSETLDILTALIAFESISSRSNLDIVAYIEAYLTKHGVDTRRIPEATGEKASILATIGPIDQPGVVLSAHTDVVPVEGQNWSSPPFKATQKDGRVVGRGATDMKGFVACVLAHVDHFKRAATATPIHLAFSYDEEVGCRGAPDLVEATVSLPAVPALCIVGEPTKLQVVRAHKGKVARRIVITGRGGHSAMPHRGANAVSAAAKIVAMLDTIGAGIARSPLRDETFDPPYSTVHVGSLHGGTALNLVPDRAVLEFEVRDVPHEDMHVLLRRIDKNLADIRTELQAKAPEADITIEEISSYPVLATAPGHPVVATVAALAGETPAEKGVSFGTEAGLYSAAGIPTVVCGPGDIARAHKADEWIGIDELAAADAMMRRLADKLARPASEWISV
jgi:acetylornithine deacetylase